MADLLAKLDRLKREHGDVELPTGQHGSRWKKCNPRDPEQIAVMHAFGGWPCLCGADRDNALLAEVREDVARLTSRITTIADEAFGPFPVQSPDASLTEIERGIFGLRQARDEERKGADEMAEALSDARAVLAEMAAPQECYGAGGGDPRDFTPDPECSTEEERARHAADCEKAARGEPIDTLTGCVAEGGALVSYQGWGLGTYTYRDDEAVERLAAVDDALAAHRARRGAP